MAANPEFPDLDPLEEVLDAVFADALGNLLKASAEEALAARNASDGAATLDVLT